MLLLIKKSFNKMKELISDENRTVIIVSHSMDTIKELCSKALWIHNGEVKMYGESREVVEKYLEFMK